MKNCNLDDLCGTKITEIAKNVAKATDDYLMDFLRSKGYRPKPTIKYIKSLMARLKQKGLKLSYYQSISYGNTENIGNNTIIKGVVKQLYFIDKINNPLLRSEDMQEMVDNWDGGK